MLTTWRPVLYVSALLLAGAGGPASAQHREPLLTSDTLEYCEVLKNRIANMANDIANRSTVEVLMLSEAGERMCVHGQIRGGISRLRQAIMILRHGKD